MSAEDLNTPCPGCGSVESVFHAHACDIEYKTSDEVFVFRRCGGCGAIYIDPIPVDRLGDIYPRNYYSFKSGRRSFAHRIKDALDRRVFRRVLADIPGRSLSILDVGGGAGLELLIARQSDPRVEHSTVVDLDPDAARLAEANGHTYWCGRFEDYDSDESFDLILMLNLIEHVADPTRVLDKARSLLSAGGTILVKTPNTDSLDARLLKNRNWGGYHCPRHWVLFDTGSFRSLAERSGLTVRSLSYTQGAPFWTVNALDILGRVGLVRVTPARPMYTNRLFAPLLACFAAFDFARSVVGMKPSQMIIELGHAENPGAGSSA